LHVRTRRKRKNRGKLGAEGRRHDWAGHGKGGKGGSGVSLTHRGNGSSVGTCPPAKGVKKENIEHKGIVLKIGRGKKKNQFS